MRLSYDPDANAALIRLVDDTGPQHSLMCDLEIDEGAVILLLDEEDRLVGIEVLGARKLLPPVLLGLSETER
jgi:uncharacterized protein YuzE